MSFTHDQVTYLRGLYAEVQQAKVTQANLESVFNGLVKSNPKIKQQIIDEYNAAQEAGLSTEEITAHVATDTLPEDNTIPDATI